MGGGSIVVKKEEDLSTSKRVRDGAYNGPESGSEWDMPGDGGLKLIIRLLTADGLSCA